MVASGGADLRGQAWRRRGVQFVGEAGEGARRSRPGRQQLALLLAEPRVGGGTRFWDAGRDSYPWKRHAAVAPGPVWTALIPATMPDTEEFGEAPVGRPAQPAEMSPAYVFLALAGGVVHHRGVRQRHGRHATVVARRGPVGSQAGRPARQLRPAASAPRWLRTTSAYARALGFGRRRNVVRSTSCRPS
ncbi:hypothetical protein SGLAM104S_04141 [Streptomyces glaucescens]